LIFLNVQFEKNAAKLSLYLSLPGCSKMRKSRKTKKRMLLFWNLLIKRIILVYH